MTKIYQSCIICNSDIPADRRGKNTCSDNCQSIKQKQINLRAYAAKMSKDPDYARKQSAKQYARIKADTDRLAEHKAKQRERNQMPSYRESLRKSWKKFKEKNKEKIAEATKKRRAEMGIEWVKMRREHESRRQKKRAEHREWLKEHDPDAYEQMLKERREYEREYRKRKRLQAAQMALQNILEKGENNE